jgi:glutaminyl-tRNA synthetase
VNNPEDESAGTRQIPFSRELYIDREDFMEDPPKKFFRLGPGREVRFRYAYFITCNDFVKDENGNITELHCTYDPESRGGNSPDGRKVKGTIHWLSARHAIDAEVRIYEHLFDKENPMKAEEGKDFLDNLNPDSLSILNSKVEPSVKELEVGKAFQFERKGYFCLDKDTAPDKLVINRTATLKDTWAKIQKKDK